MMPNTPIDGVDLLESEGKKSDVEILNNIRKEAQRANDTAEAKEYTRDGAIDGVNRDFDALNPINARNLENGIRTGQLSDGKQVVLRPAHCPKGDDPGSPTLEIQSR